MHTEVNAVVTVTIPKKAVSVHNAQCIFAAYNALLFVSCIPTKKNVILSATFEDIAPADLENIVSEFENIGLEAFMKVITHATTFNED